MSPCVDVKHVLLFPCRALCSYDVASVMQAAMLLLSDTALLGLLLEHRVLAMQFRMSMPACQCFSDGWHLPCSLCISIQS